MKHSIVLLFDSSFHFDIDMFRIMKPTLLVLEIEKYFTKIKRKELNTWREYASRSNKNNSVIEIFKKIYENVFVVIS